MALRFNFGIARATENFLCATTVADASPLDVTRISVGHVPCLRFVSTHTSA